MSNSFYIHVRLAMFQWLIPFWWPRRCPLACYHSIYQIRAQPHDDGQTLLINSALLWVGGGIQTENDAIDKLDCDPAWSLSQWQQTHVAQLFGLEVVVSIPSRILVAFWLSFWTCCMVAVWFLCMVSCWTNGSALTSLLIASFAG